MRRTLPSLFVLAIWSMPAYPETRYFQIARRTADTLLDYGRDTFGPKRTGMFLSMLDRTTLRPPTTMPEAPMGVRPGDRTNMYGANANLDQNLFLALQYLSQSTGDPKYAKAADAALLDLFRLTQHPTTGLLGWGEHLFWDTQTDRAASLAKFSSGIPAGTLIHEPKRKLMFFDFIYEAEPKRTIDFARGIWEHQIADQETGNFSRHARYDGHGPNRDADFQKEAGYYIDLWSRTYQRTKNPLFLHAIDVLASRYLRRMNKLNLLDYTSSPAPDLRNYCLTNHNLILAIEAYAAASRVDEATATKLKHLADRLDKGFLALAHAPDDAKRGFQYSLHTDTGKLRARKGDDGHSRHWALGYGVKSTSLFGVLCHSRYRQLKDGPMAKQYRDLFLRAANLYRSFDAAPATQDIWAGEFGMAIFLEIAAFRATEDKAYSAAARKLADQAIEVFWEDKLLPRASSKTSQYESITFTDTLVLSLLALDEQLSGRKPLIEISDVDR